MTALKHDDVEYPEGEGSQQVAASRFGAGTVEHSPTPPLDLLAF